MASTDIYTAVNHVRHHPQGPSGLRFEPSLDALSLRSDAISSIQILSLRVFFDVGLEAILVEDCAVALG